MKLLLTAFDPFGGSDINPAQEAVKLLPHQLDDIQIIKLEVPTIFHESIKTVAAAMEKERPDVVLCVGQAGGRYDVTPERVAINVDDARIPDNAGNQPLDTPIFADGAPAYFSSLPIKAIVQEIRKSGLPSSVSNTAGTFVCNHLMYGVLYHIDKYYPKMRGGFIHVPFIPQQVLSHPSPAPYMSQIDIAKALEAAIKAILVNEQDIIAAGGREH